ncbi:RNA recognition motif domain-containing protein [Ferruginibacter albus]|uniref:RNA recognition motif domain-containing protein n=1 Tax=Ferruginibacter albus TaxID=2875540 RepID=UPI001CC64BEC|nr:RNA-binding protein [Ferruginibacter albus]UAY51333.1 RNA-binding protein [Ferruginibacter albus]
MNMYVSNLSFNVDETELNNLFSAFGTVTSVKIITDRETGRSRGFGFVEMSSDAEAKKAMDDLNFKEIDGRKISVAEAREKTERSGGGSGFRSNSRGNSGGYNNKW